MIPLPVTGAAPAPQTNPTTSDTSAKPASSSADDRAFSEYVDDDQTNTRDTRRDASAAQDDREASQDDRKEAEPTERGTSDSDDQDQPNAEAADSAKQSDNAPVEPEDGENQNPDESPATAETIPTFDTALAKAQKGGEMPVTSVTALVQSPNQAEMSRQMGVSTMGAGAALKNAGDATPIAAQLSMSGQGKPADLQSQAGRAVQLDAGLGAEGEVLPDDIDLQTLKPVADRSQQGPLAGNKSSQPVTLTEMALQGRLETSGAEKELRREVSGNSREATVSNAANSLVGGSTAPTTAATWAATSTAAMVAQVKQADAGKEMVSFDVVGEAEHTTLSLSQSRSATSSQTVSPLAAPDLPRNVAAQIANALPTATSEGVELTLNPRELGRVVLALSGNEASMTLSVVAERPETLDLIRRNLDLLAQEFSALGYENLNLSLGQSGTGSAEGESNDQQGTSDLSAAGLLENEVEGTGPVTLALTENGSLDIRL